MSERDPRYERQVLVAELGIEGQRRLLDSRVLIVGCGALGSNLASLCVRAGVGHVRIVDRDRIERSNLARQTLYDEDDVAARRHKSEAAAAKLRRINGDVTVEDHVLDVGADNIEGLLDGVDVVLDGADNFETRYLLNDACCKHGVPWVYGGVVATTGMSLTVVPGEGPCLRCLFPRMPPPGSLPSTDVVGVLNTAPALIACVQVTEAFKLLVDPARAATGLLHVDLWTRGFRTLEVRREPSCPACGQGRYEFLEPQRSP